MATRFEPLSEGAPSTALRGGDARGLLRSSGPATSRHGSGLSRARLPNAKLSVGDRRALPRLSITESVMEGRAPAARSLSELVPDRRRPGAEARAFISTDNGHHRRTGTAISSAVAARGEVRCGVEGLPHRAAPGPGGDIPGRVVAASERAPVPWHSIFPPPT